MVLFNHPLAHQNEIEKRFNNSLNGCRKAG